MYQLTGDWVNEIGCDIRVHRDESKVVYFGSDQDLVLGGNADYFLETAIFDAFKNSDNTNRIGFYFNEDPECRKAKDLDENKNYMIFYNGALKPFEVEIGPEAEEKWMKPGFLLGLTNARHALANPKWNSRTKDAIFSYEYSGLVYITEEKLEREEEK